MCGGGRGFDSLTSHCELCSPRNLKQERKVAMWPFKKKKIETLVSNETHTVEAIQLWYVTWGSIWFCNSGVLGELNKEVEAFPTKEEADEFATSLRKAKKLWRISGGVYGPSVSKR